MNTNGINRRQFIESSAVAAGALLLAPAATVQTQAAVKRTAVDQVSLGNTGIKLSRLGMGAGSNSGNVQRSLGKEGFNKLIRYAYDKGITYFDCAQSYQTFEWIGDAVKDLPREKLFLTSKVSGQPENILETIDKHRKTYKTDYIDALLIHCMVKGTWTEELKRIMDAFDEAKEKKWIRTKGVTCHSLPALRAAVQSSWPDVHLLRINPQAKHIDGMAETWNKSGDDIAPVLAEMKKCVPRAGEYWA